MRRLAPLAFTAVLLACGGDCPDPAAESGSTAGAEAPNQNAGAARTAAEERTDLLERVTVVESATEMRAVLEGSTYADALAEATRTSCLAALDAPEGSSEAQLQGRACLWLLEHLEGGGAGGGAAAGAPRPYDATHHGALTDDDPRVPDDESPYDEIELDVRQGWTVVGDMRSTDFDTYLWLIGPDGRSAVQDDDGGVGTNSFFSFVAAADGRYIVRANSYDGSGRGRYELHIVAGPDVEVSPPAGEPAAGEPSIGEPNML